MLQLQAVLASRVLELGEGPFERRFVFCALAFRFVGLPLQSFEGKTGRISADECEERFCFLVHQMSGQPRGRELAGLCLESGAGPGPPCCGAWELETFFWPAPGPQAFFIGRLKTHHDVHHSAHQEKTGPPDPGPDQELGQDEPPIILHRSGRQIQGPGRQSTFPTISSAPYCPAQCVMVLQERVGFHV